MNLRLDAIDAITARELHRRIRPDDHLSRACSHLQTNGILDCDCGALGVAFARAGGHEWERYVPEEHLELARARVARRPRGRPRSRPTP